MNSSWRFRKEALVRLKTFFSNGGQFDTSTSDMDIANLKRDFLLIFGSEEELDERTLLEAKVLPQNQKHNHHERYALVTELAYLKDSQSLNSVVELVPSDLIGTNLASHYDHLERNTPKVSETWLQWSIENGSRLGRLFWSQSKVFSEKFLEDVTLAVRQEEAGEDVQKPLIGLRAFGFLDVDPLLSDPKVIKQEEDLSTFILEYVRDNNVTP